MREEHVIREQLAEFAPIVDQFIEVVNTTKKAFLSQRDQLLTQLNNQQDPLCREIGSAMLKMSEVASAQSADAKEPYLTIHSILTHLSIIAETTCRLEETLHKQIKDGILFSDKAVSQVSQIFDQQTAILSGLADMMRNGVRDFRQRVIEACDTLAQSCLQFGTDHEVRLVEGLCFPQAAPLFLAILDQIQIVVHHEREVAKLLGNDFF